MVRSMTGFGRVSCEPGNKTVSIELKSLNSKQIDINTKLPFLYREKDIEIRNYITQYLKRGKIDLLITVENNNGDNIASLNTEIIKSYYNQIKQLCTDLKIQEDQILNTLIRLPESVKMNKEELDDEEWNCVFENIRKAITELDNHRKEEGARLIKDIVNRIAVIKNLYKQINKHKQSRIDRIKERIDKNIKEFIEPDKIDQNRFEQEIIYYLEKLDITEEIIRLESHCEYFINTVANEEIVGKKLSFISQEMGREINTIGSKANNPEIQKIVVQMKDELEKIKEQLMNIL